MERIDDGESVQNVEDHNVFFVVDLHMLAVVYDEIYFIVYQESAPA